MRKLTTIAVGSALVMGGLGTAQASLMARAETELWHYYDFTGMSDPGEWIPGGPPPSLTSNHDGSFSLSLQQGEGILHVWKVQKMNARFSESGAGYVDPSPVFPNGDRYEPSDPLAPIPPNVKNNPSDDTVQGSLPIPFATAEKFSLKIFDDQNNETDHLKLDFGDLAGLAGYSIEMSYENALVGLLDQTLDGLLQQSLVTGSLTFDIDQAASGAAGAIEMSVTETGGFTQQVQGLVNGVLVTIAQDAGALEPILGLLDLQGGLDNLNSLDGIHYVEAGSEIRIPAPATIGLLGLGLLGFGVSRRRAG